MPRRVVSPDPLATVTQPPPDESPADRALRAQAEAEARRISAAIDAQIADEKEQLRKKASKHEVKVVLLGQAESGKSTLRKQFQLQWASRTLDAERVTWRPIVVLNIIRGLRNLFEQLENAFNPNSQSPISASSPPSVFHSERSNSRGRNQSRSSSPGSTTLHDPLYPPFSFQEPLDPAVAAARDELLYLRSRLIPLIALEDSLTNSISGMVHTVGGVYVRSDWQASYPREPPIRSNSAPPSITSTSTRHERTQTDLPTVFKCLASCKDDIRQLWHHPYLPVLLKSRRIKLEDSVSFFLSAVERISHPDYSPTDADILHVRLQTLGVSQHIFDVTASGRPVRWILYDVGGARGLRQAWAPYFDDATAIIFLAPISAFDQYLDEDPRTNRIDDSLQIFQQICCNKLLNHANLILLLNKTDLLRQKIEAGIRVKKFITSFADRSNTYEEASQYFRAHFLQTHRKHDVSKRTLYAHFTSVIDVKATKKIIFNVADAILKDHIANTGLV